MFIHFTQVGRNKQSWISRCPGQLTQDFMEQQVRSHGVNSHYIDFSQDGGIYAGLQRVGEFRLEMD